jgi:hypothetical protein
MISLAATPVINLLKAQGQLLGSMTSVALAAAALFGGAVIRLGLAELKLTNYTFSQALTHLSKSGNTLSLALTNLPMSLIDPQFVVRRSRELKLAKTDAKMDSVRRSIKHHTPGVGTIMKGLGVVIVFGAGIATGASVVGRN